MSEIIRVLLADDHPTLRVGLRILLDQAPDVEVVGEAEDGAEALALIEATQPDVAVLDCQLPGMGGPQVAAEIKQRGLPTKVLALSAYDEDHYLRGMWSAGALGYLLKSEAPGAIVAAVRTVAQGEQLWTVEQLARVRHWREEVEQRWKSLTEREREVLLLVATGKSNREIADRLCITEKTVEKHVSNVLGKLMLVSRTEVALWAVKTGLVSV